MSENVEKRFAFLAKYDKLECGVVGLLLIISMFLGDTNIGSLISYAADVGIPEIGVTFVKRSGGEDTDSDRTTLLANGEPVFLSLQMDPKFTTGHAEDLYFKIDLPYFYYDSNGRLITTYNFDEIPADQQSDEKLMGLRARITDYGDFYYNNTEQDNTKYLKGHVELSASGASLISGQPKGIVLEVSFFGDVPENASGIVKSGGAYGKYVTAQEEESDGGFEILPGKSEGSNYTVVNSNLRWQLQVEQVGQQTMWDQYNYMTYKVTIENTSESEKSYFEPFAINFNVPCEAQSTTGGILDKDLMAWIYNVDTKETTKNDNIDITSNNYYTGVPSQGGILVYDVTDKDDTKLSEWDTETYKNVEDTPMYYSVTNNRLISIPVDKRVNYQESRTYYIAVPFTNNFPASTQYKIPTTFYPTVYLGTDIKWSKTVKFDAQFAAPMPGFTHEKYVLDDNGAKVKEHKIAIGAVGTYYISGFKNTGNLPVFDPIVTDTLPENYALQKITIQMDKSSEEDPELSEWFKIDNILEFGFVDSDGVLTWMNLGSFSDETGTTDGKEWSVDLKGKVEDYLAANPNQTFTRQMRFHLTERINRNIEFKGRIVVEGITKELAVYENNLETTFDEKLWVPATSGTEDQYERIPQTVTNDKATLTVAPATPIIQAVGYRKNSDGTYQYGTPATGNDTLGIPLKYDGVGFRFNLGNTSISPARPVVFNSGNILTLSGNKKGLQLDKIILSKKLLEVAKVDYIVLTDSDGDDTRINNSNLPSPNSAGDIVIKDLKNSKVSNVQVVFKHFNAQIAFTDEAYLMLDGSTNTIGEIPIESTFETKYSDNAYNTIAKDQSTLISNTIYPNMEGVSYDADGNVSGINKGAYTTATQPSSISGLNVPRNKDNNGFKFTLFNKSESGAGETNLWIDFVNTGVKNDVSTGDAPIVQGFLLKDLMFSSNLSKVGAIDKILFYDYGQDETDPETVPVLELDWSSMIPEADGSWHIKESYLSSVDTTRIKKIKIVLSEFFGQSDPTNPERLEIKVNGNSDQWGTMDAVMSFEPLDDTMADKKMKVTARLNTIQPNLVLRSYSYDNNNNKTSNEAVTTSNTRYSLTVPNKADNTGYVLKITNESQSETGNTEALVDLTATGIKNDMTIAGATPVVKGFLIKDITFKNLLEVGEIDRVDFYDYDQDPTLASENPKCSVAWSQLTADENGNYTIPDSMISGATRVKSFKIYFKNIYGQADMLNKKTLEIQIDGKTDWFDDLDAKLQVEMKDKTMYNWASSTRIKSIYARLHIDRPSLMIHTNIDYYDNTKETSHYAQSCSDGTETRLGIPYDRDFKYRVSIENETISVLDDVDVRIQLPITMDDGTKEGNTGFHATKVVINKAFMEQFEEFEQVTFYDKNSTKDVTYKYDKTTKELLKIDGEGNVIEESKLPKNADGNWEFKPKEIEITSLSEILFTGDRVKLKDDSTADAWVDFYGYSDSNFGTNNYIYANADNYLDGIREDVYKLHTQDQSYSVVSKMYFDTVLAAGYKDTEAAGTTMTEATRFDQTSSALEHVREYYRPCMSYFNDDSELDIGYKAIGSYMLDFRQYLNVGGKYPSDYPNAGGANSYIWQEHQNSSWIYTQSLNTSANVAMTMTLPKDYFDAYYVKIHPDALSYLQSLTVEWQNGTTKTYEKADWVSKQSIEKDDSGQDYYVVAIADLGDGTTGNYKTPKNYGTPENPVAKVSFSIDINKEESETTADGTKQAKNPDYGTWFDARNPSTQYMFEVTGRFYKSNEADNSKAEAKVNTTLTVGGTERDGLVSKIRTDSGEDHNNSTDKNRSKWSYWNKYRAETSHHYGSPSYCNTTDLDYDAGHLVSKARVFVRNDSNNVLKGVHDDTTQEYDDGVEFGSKQYYSVAFYRTSKSVGQYSGGQDSGNWKSQDADDWYGRLSYADTIYLEDTLPYIANDAESEYKGFRTEDILFSEELYKYIDEIVFTLDDGSTVTMKQTDLKKNETSGYYEVLLKYNELGETATSGSTNEILLPDTVFLRSYKVTLKDIPGSADYARELFGRTDLLQPDYHDNKQKIDIKVGGRVNLVKNLHKDEEGTNTITPSYQNDDMSRPVTGTSDRARLMGYQIAFCAGWDIDRLTTGTEYDYVAADDTSVGAIQNITPKVTSFGVKLWNREDKSTSGKDATARLKAAVATNTLPTAFNLERIHIPKEFVEGSWFKISKITMNYYNSRSAEFLLDSQYLKRNTGTGDYYLDVNEFIKDHVKEFRHYNVSNTNSQYVNEHIDKFVVEFEAVNPNINDDATLLDGGQYISKDKAVGYAFTYDGVWVDRTEADIALDKDTADSRPTFGYDPNLYEGINPTSYVSASFTPADMNAEKTFYTASGTDSDESYNVRNLVGQLAVRLDRGYDAGFAYDRNKVTIGESSTIVEHTVDQDHLIPYDYVNYTLTAGATGTTAIPLQHTDMRFTVPTGQRIVGWEIKNNNVASVQNNEITATVKDASGSDITLKPNNYYVAETDGTATNYKEINISIGAKGDVVDGDMIKAGEQVQIIVYTQLTAEITSFEGSAIANAAYSVTSKPKHTFSQYSIFGLNTSGSITGNNDSWGSSYYYQTENNTNSAINYYRYNTDFYRLSGTPYTGANYTAVINSKLTFRKMDDDLHLTYEYTDMSAQYDRQGMIVKMYNAGKTAITNDTRHTLKEMTFEVSFLSQYNKSDKTERWFKSFELTKKPQFTYPTNMTNAGDPVDTWYLVDVDGTDEWIEAKYIKEGEVTEAEAEQGLHSTTEVKKVKWTYYNIPEMGTDGNEVLFASAAEPFTFEGLGLYNNIRENDSTKIADRYNMKLDAKMSAVHEHVEERVDADGNNYVIKDELTFAGIGNVTTAIARERPVLTYQTQIFSNETEASAPYQFNAVQKKGYRPGDTMWYKVTVKNNKLTAAKASTDMQGVLIDPVFYDKVPEYVSADMSQIKIRWLDVSGNAKENAPALEVSGPTIMNAPDYGGDMVTDKNTLSEGNKGNNTGYYFADIVPTAGNSTKIDYQVYQFGFAEGTRLEVGEQIEIWYPVTVREQNLPMNYVRDGNGNVYPEYYPKIGSYYQLAFYSSNGTSWPLGNETRVSSIADGYRRNIKNSSIMMDMNYLIHDVGVSGTLNKDIDRWEFLKESTTYIPGTSSNNPTTSYSEQIYGNNNRYLDMDSAADSIYQEVVYTPNLSTGNSNLDELPDVTKYNKSGESASRDVYEKIVKPRSNVIETAWDNISGEEKHIPILWSEARSHLQTAWIATSSEIIPDHEADDTTTTDYTNHAKQYLENAYTRRTGYGLTNPNYNVYLSSDFGAQARHSFLPDDHVPTIEYDESYTARLSAYNYGDWGVDGVEFIYVLPRGISPEKDESGNFIINGKTLTSGDSSSSISSGDYTAIDGSNIAVEVLQNPNESQSYLSPKSIQDPILSTAAWNTTSDLYDEQYYSQEDSQSWVLKITVKQPLKKWFNRGTDKGYILHVDVRCHVDSTNESEYWYDKVFTRPIEVDGGNDSAFYQIYDITSWDGDTKDKATQAQGSLSTQFAGMDYLWDGYDNIGAVDGATAYNSGSPNMPYINGFNIQNNEVFVNENVNGTVAAGNLHDYYAAGQTATYASTGTRAQMRKPMIRTWTTLGEDLGDNWNGSNLASYYVNTEGEQSAINIHVENKYYWDEQATNGHGRMTYGDNNANGYMKHLHNYSTDGGNEGTFFFPVVTDILPAGTVPMYKEVDEAGNISYKKYTQDNNVNATKTLDWTLYDKSGSDLSSEQMLYKSTVEYIEIANEEGVTEGRFKVTFYQDRDTQGDNTDAKILSGEKRIFSLRMVTVADPDINMKDGTEAGDLLKQYQTNRVYVTSQLKGFKFKIDGDVSGNPYYVGANWNPYYVSDYSIGDPQNSSRIGRTDSIKSNVRVPNTSISYVTGGYLPNSSITILKNLMNGTNGVTYSIIDSVQTKGNRRYFETGADTAADIFQMEDYEAIRESLPLGIQGLQTDFNLSGSTEHQDGTDGPYADTGVYTSMRIRTKSPRIKVEAYVSEDDAALGMRDTKAGTAVAHYPTSGFDDKGYEKTDADHKQYGDKLYYTAKISNKPSSSVAYEEMGDVHHAKIVLSIVLPSNVSYEDNYYIEKNVDGVKQRFSAEDLANAGWDIKLRTHEVDSVTKEETLVYEITTPGETTSYEEYLQGKHVAGFFATGDEFDFKVETVIDNLESEDTVRTTPDYWDKEYYADMYVTLEDTAGTFTGIEGIAEQSTVQTKYVNEVKEQEATDTDEAVSYDKDTQYDERFASDRTARITVMKPSATVRLDTSIKRLQINNPDAGVVIAEDASIKGATVSQIYLDQAVNTGGAVGEFIVDYRVPHRGTTTGTIYEAPMTGNELITTIDEIRTGVWEVPTTVKERAYDTTKYNSYYEALCDILKVSVYVLLEEEPENRTYDNPGAYNEYVVEKESGTQWECLGTFGLTENKKITIKPAWQQQIRQIRFVVKAADTDEDGDGSADVNDTQTYPVPKGFRLDVDADIRTENVKEEMDEIDPKRANIELAADKKVPNNVSDNAAFIQISMKHKHSSSMKLHANNFATVWARYDDEKYTALSDPARAGYYINVELPVIQKDLTPYYFYRTKLEDGTNEYRWSSTNLLINQTYSAMLKYMSVIKNLSKDQIAAADIQEEPDNATRPTMSVVLPYIQDIDDNHFEYVDAYSSDYAGCYVNSDYVSSQKLTKNQAQWSYKIVDEDGNQVANPAITDCILRTYEKQVDLSGNARKVLTWDFTGYLRPGESLVVEYMVPISTKDYGIVSTDLMTCSSHGYLEGSFKQHIPESSSTNETYSVEVDARDINENGKTISETALIKRVGGLAFDSDRTITRLKYSYSEYDTAGLQITRPALVPEGTNYAFKSAGLNPDKPGDEGFTKTVIYDVLPYENDKTIVNANELDTNKPAERSSKWSGWLLPDTIVVSRVSSNLMETINTALEDGVNCEIWVGPFTKDATGKIVAGERSDLPRYEQTKDAQFYQDTYLTQTEKEKYFVKLSELLALKQTSPAEYLELSKKVGAIWVQVMDKEELRMDGGVKYELNYSMHAPLNLPQYPELITSDMDDKTILNKVVDYTGWNTFAIQANEASNAGTKWPAMESPQAGVYLNAPAEKGYIGSYVWYDENYNMTEDEGEYERRSDGRLIFKNATKDLDFDGQPDDPGINNVLVELLTENGYPANKLGEAVVEVEENGVTKYILIDEETGLKAQDANGTYLYTTEGPATYTTEADAYGNNGYFIISNVTPGNYKLRYTLPEGTYNKYAVTTLEIGTTNTAMDIYRPGDTLPDLGNAGTGDTASDAMSVTNNLIVQTRDSIQIDAIGTEPSTYSSYDEKMTSYNVGVSKSYVYGGYAWVDESDDGSGNITSDGIYDKTKEDALENVEVTFYEVVDGELKKAKDVNGDPAECKTDANGYFEIYLYPNRTYVARTSTVNTNDIYKPSPITINTDPLAAKDDNDLMQTADKKQETFLFSTGIKYDETGTPIMTAEGNYGLYDYIGLGYVHSGRGFIGKYIWDDKNYDGIRNSYVSDGTSKNEPGIAGVTLILEKYYYYDGEWVPVPDENKTITSNSGGSYTFQNVSTSYMRTDPDTGQITSCLAGYKVKVDMASFPSDYVITKYQMNGGADDSDLPVNATDANSYLTAGAKDTDQTGKYIIIAEDATDSSQSDYIYDLGDKSYDMATAKMILDLDLGLTFKEAGEISGKIWEDKTYDGLQNTYQADETTVEESGIAGVELEAIQYYYKDNNWVQNHNYVSPSITTDADGNYQIVGQETYVTVDGVKYLAGYKVRVKAIDGKYAVTKYRVGTDTTIDSDLVDENLYLTADEEYLILAKDIADADYAGDREYIITNNLGNFDINKAVNTGDHDGGLVEYQKADLYGCIWEDRNYNGIFDAEETGIENTSLTLVQYYLDGDENWQKVPDWTVRTMNSDAGGAYRFEDLDAHAVVDGKHYLAGYRVEVEKDSAPDKELYGITLYRVGTTGERQ